MTRLSGINRRQSTMMVAALVVFMSSTNVQPAQAGIVHAAFHTTTSDQTKGGIKGKVMTSDNKPAEFATVSIEGGATTRVNKEGSFQFDNLEAGTYKLVLTFVGQEPQDKTITVQAGEVAEVTFTIGQTAKALNEVVIVGDKYSVTARKRSNNIARLPLANLENPQVYSVVNKELMQEQSAITLDEAFRNVPGAAPSKTGAGLPAFFSRGFTTSDNLRNGMATYIRTTIDLATVDRVEAIKGPSGALFGGVMTSFGGLINYITKKPYNRMGGEVSYTTGSFDFSRVTADFNTPLNDDKTLLFRVNTAFQKEGSFQDQGHGTTFIFAPGLTYQVNDRFTLHIDADMQNYKGTSSSAWWIVNSAAMNAKSFDQMKFDYKRSLIDNSFLSKQSSNNIFIQAEYKLAKGWTSATNYAWATGEYNDLYYFNLKYLTDSSVQRTIAVHSPDKLGRKHLQQNFTGDFKIGNMRNRLVVGVDVMEQYRNLKYYGTYTLDTVYARQTARDVRVQKVDKLVAENEGIAESMGRQYAYGAYASDVLNLFDNLLLMASLRIDRFDNRGTRNNLTQIVSGKFAQTALSPKLGIVYQPVKDQVAVFANYMNGYKNVITPVNAYNNEEFKPQYANQWEGGFKLDLLKNKLNATVSVYDIKVTNLTMNSLIDPTKQVQDGTQESKGFEVEVIGNPIPGLNFVTNYGFNENEFTNATASQNIIGKRAGGTPKHVANAWVSYSILKGEAKGLGIGAGAMYVSEAFYDQTNTFILPGYMVVDATVFYNQPKYRLSIKGNNLTNKKYWVSDGFYARPQKTINFLVSLAWKFGSSN